MTTYLGSDSSDETHARRERARELYATNGWTMAAIGRELGVSGQTVKKYLRGMPLSKNRQSATGRAQSAKVERTNETQLATRAAVVFEMRTQGQTYYQIAQTLKLDPRTVRADVERELEQRVSPKVLEYRELEDARLDRYLDKLSPKIEAGDPKAIQTALNISVRRARLHGLDSPVRIDMIKTEVTQEDLAIQELIREAQMRNAITHQEIVEAQVVGDDSNPAA